MGEPDLSCRRPGLALLRCAQPAVHPLPPRSTGDTRDDVVDCGDGVAARMGMVCHRRRTAQAPSQPIIVRRDLLECQTHAVHLYIQGCRAGCQPRPERGSLWANHDRHSTISLTCRPGDLVDRFPTLLSRVFDLGRRGDPALARCLRRGARPNHKNSTEKSELEIASSHDSLLEGAGFEPSVPLLRKVSRLLPKGDAGPISWMGSLSTGRLARRRWSAAGPLSTAVSFSAGPMVRIRFPPSVSQANFQLAPLGSSRSRRTPA